MRPFPLVSIIAVNYNQPELTGKMVDSIRRSAYPNTEVFVVENGPVIPCANLMKEQYPEVQIVESKENLGFASANNLAVQICNGDFLFFLNNDAELTKGALEKLVNLYEKIPHLGAVSPLICDTHTDEDEGMEEPDVIQYAGYTPLHPVTARNSVLGAGEIDQGQYRKVVPTAYCHGAAMLVSREVIEKVGPWPEEYIFYYDELDWCEQIRRAGYKIHVEPNAKVYHQESSTIGKQSAVKTYFINRSRILFVRRNRKGWQLLLFWAFLFFFTIPKNTLVNLLQGNFGNLNAFYKAVLWNVRGGSQAPVRYDQF